MKELESEVIAIERLYIKTTRDLNGIGPILPLLIELKNNGVGVVDFELDNFRHHIELEQEKTVEELLCKVHAHFE